MAEPKVDEYKDKAGKAIVLNGIPIPIPVRLVPYFVLFMGFFLIICMILWLNYILSGQVPAERMNEYITAMLFCLGIVVFCFWYFRWSRRRLRKNRQKR